jgi:transcription elongation factor Elf1
MMTCPHCKKNTDPIYCAYNLDYSTVRCENCGLIYYIYGDVLE